MANEEGKGRGQEVIASDTCLESFQLRARGMTYREIGKALNISHQTAYLHVKAIIESNYERTRELGLKYVEVEIELLDRMLKSIETKAADGDVAAQEMVLKIMARRSKYLGLDAPERKEISGEIGLKDLILGSLDTKPKADEEKK